MAEGENGGEPVGLSVRALDIGVALAFIGLGAVVMVDNHRRGAAWGPDGPESGYFPFYVGLVLVLSAAIVLVQAIFRQGRRRIAIDRAQARSVLALLLPTIVYVAVMAYIGIYVSSAIYLVYFMRLLGRYRWRTIVPISIGIPFILFVLFEVWFLVPLPKGPLEDWLGY
jgi:hypothetical protein